MTFRPIINKAHVTFDDLNKAYGDKGETRTTLKAAKRFQQENGGYITKCVDYNLVQIKTETHDSIGDKGKRMQSTRVFIGKGELPHTVGYLISLV